ncbi:calcium-binding protein [Thalassococcus sp. S3]|uniref:calcium-binding protein n=1 Tax=Thalassococcus sp. S3 TaxID=2017482 RepID=UPI0013EE5FBB|nr:calcium-binding protein [Thalassococcus sp. S3]
MTLRFLDSTDTGHTIENETGSFVIRDTETITNFDGGAQPIFMRDVTNLDLTNFGKIESENDAVRIEGGNGRNLVLHNQGEIIGFSGIVVQSAGSGTIINGAGATIRARLDGITNTGLNTDIINYGDIIIEDDAPARSTGVIIGGNQNDLDNFGTISADIGVEVFGANSEIKNSGVIQGNRIGIKVTDSALGIEIHNSGEIIGGIVTSNFADVVYNEASILGAVRLNGGNDLYDGSSSFESDKVFGGSGNDTLLGGFDNDQFFGDSGNDNLSGASGDDQLSGGAGNDLIGGGADNDSLVGGSGQDLIWGGTGNDHIEGGTGKDTLNGGRGNDEIFGGGQDDTINGGAGDDLIRGGSGNDMIDGGTGRDTLFGGEGSDVFIYTSANQSTPDNQADIIADFTRGEDLIDITGMSDLGAFSFVDAFSASGQAEVRAQAFQSGNVVVFIDVDGDGQADSAIRVLGQDMLDMNDFIL